MVFDRQQVLRLLIEPVGAGQSLALGTVAVAARVVGDALVAAVEAMLDMATQGGSATACQVAQRLPLPTGQRAAVAPDKAVAVLSNHVRHFPSRPRRSDGGHDGPSADA